MTIGRCVCVCTGLADLRVVWFSLGETRERKKTVVRIILSFFLSFFLFFRIVLKKAVIYGFSSNKIKS